MSKDTIYRQDAIDALKRISFLHCFECGEYLSEDTREIEIINSNKALEVIEALPSVQPERGHWIEIRNKRGVVIAIKCDKCSRFPKRGVKSDFCPNCGADMRGEQDG